MKKALLFILFTFTVQYVNSQQRICFYYKNYSSEIQKNKVYKLPQQVTCFYKNGKKVQHILEKVSGDTLVFEKIQYTEIHETCLYNDLTKIKFHKKGEIPLYVLTAGTAGLSALFLSVLVIGIPLSSNTEGGGIGPAIIPFTIISGIFGGITLLVLPYLPKTFKNKKYQILVL